ncbi:hypothetical protein BU23DRAFT_569720 [Bimuria novae-zelandiae CBS 107.79]|uniref:Uncharacterized protein n=1 Tax=Bimuria novae-zelandiae CBS 107.79 TaxID=1447943 RepID=A0A6A5V697_9PLEO|nr:hypothetical protein BU23DRAFT_569720 [Bimuria novae-zelandiae CBS 107.79]
MGNCGSALNCDQCYSPESSSKCMKEIAVDADIAGIGVLVGFFAAAVITCASVAYAYFADSLPSSLLSGLDHAVIRRFQRSILGTKFFPAIGRLWYSFKGLLYRCLRLKEPTQRPSLARDQRVEAFTRLILGFSDQQLVTGLAILIAAVANSCQLTIYEVQIVFSLAWFSATSHITTLIVLREYFFDHKIVRNWRVFAIVAFLVLICFVQTILLLAGIHMDVGRPVQCVINGTSRRSETSFKDVISETYPLIFLVVTYGTYTYLLFVDPRDSTLRNTTSNKALASFRWLGRNKSLGERKTLVENAHYQCLCLYDYYLPSRFHFSTHVYKYSFLHATTQIMYYLAFGISQTATYTWIDSPKTTDDVRRMGFGQVVALALLAIPILAGMEIYNGIHTLLDLNAHVNLSIEVHESASSNSDNEPITPDSTEVEPGEQVSPSNRAPEENTDSAPTARSKAFDDLRITIRKQLDKHPTLSKPEPDRCNFIASSLAAWMLLNSKRRRQNHNHNHNHRKQKSIITALFLIDAAIQIYCGADLTGWSAIALWISFGLSLLVDLREVVIQVKLFKFQLSLLNDCGTSTPCSQDNKGSSEGKLTCPQLRMLDDDSIEVVGGNVEHSDEDFSLSPLQRMDTEADLGVVTR